jgi:hypothetical protein
VNKFWLLGSDLDRDWDSLRAVRKEAGRQVEGPDLIYYVFEGAGGHVETVVRGVQWAIAGPAGATKRKDQPKLVLS